MQNLSRKLMRFVAISGLALLAACDHEAGQNIDEGGFGTPTEINQMAMTGQATLALQHRFAAEVPTTITFPFNESTITPEAQAILARQASWILQFPEVRFRIYGYADLVGSNSYNYALGLRRARAVVAYFGTLGISRSRLEAVVSYGETRPVVLTQGPEQRNRRTVTEVTGFTKGYSGLLDGKYADVLYREYIASATRPIAAASTTNSSVNPGK